MQAATETRPEANLSILSSVSADVWHGNEAPGSYEWWYFDAMSDDGAEVIVIWFLDNSVSSPRYNRKLNTSRSMPKTETPATRFPGVFFAYYKNGKPLYRAFNEFTVDDFDADPVSPACRIGKSGFRFDSAPYGSGYTLHISSSLPGNRTLEAKFEWVLIESDFHRDRSPQAAKLHQWNMVAPRSDVSGRISVLDKKGDARDIRHFRGTGYHDHEADSRPFADTISEKLWGRVHFADTTAIFQKFHETGCTVCTKLFIVKDGNLSERDVQCEEQNPVRNKFGIRYSSRITFSGSDGVRLRIKPAKLLDASFYNLRFAAEMTLALRDGKPRKSMGIVELTAPKTLKYRWLDWLADRKILRIQS